MTTELKRWTGLSSEEWLAKRRGRITSSTVAACLGLDPHCTPLQAYSRITGQGQGSEPTPAMLRGTALEPTVLEEPCRREPCMVKFAAAFVTGGDWRADSADCLYTNSLTRSRFVGEGKTSAQGSAHLWGADGSTDVPEHVLVQCLWHLAHWPDTAACVVPVLLGGWQFEFRVLHVLRDEQTIGLLLDRAERFYRDHVEPLRPPAATERDDEILRRLYPSHREGKFLLDTGPELDGQLNQYRGLRNAIRELESAKRALSATLRATLQDAEGARTAEHLVSYRQTKGRLVTDWEAVARDLARDTNIDAFIERHTHLKPGPRVLRVTPRKESHDTATNSTVH